MKNCIGNLCKLIVAKFSAVTLYSNVIEILKSCIFCCYYITMLQLQCDNQWYCRDNDNTINSTIRALQYYRCSLKQYDNSACNRKLYNLSRKVLHNFLMIWYMVVPALLQVICNIISLCKLKYKCACKSSNTTFLAKVIWTLQKEAPKFVHILKFQKYCSYKL